jgi:hypothetical protein
MPTKTYLHNLFVAAATNSTPGWLDVRGDEFCNEVFVL